MLPAHAVYPNNVDDDQDELAAALQNAGGTGVASWMVSEPYINLWLFDQPMTYATSYGGPIGFGVAYKQRNSRANNNIFSLGPHWEASWLTYIEYTVDNGQSPPLVTVGKTYVPLGGVRLYEANGTTIEYKSISKMSKLTDGGGNLTGFEINYRNGARDIYSYLLNISSSQNYALLTQQIDAVGRTNKFVYDTISNVVRLRQMIDSDNRTNIVRYHGTYTAQINEVENPYGVKALFSYDGNGKLSSIVNVGGLTNSFVYDAQGLVTNLVTAYGTTKFKTTTNAFAPYNLGGTNQVNRSIEITEANGKKQLFLYRDQSTKLNPNSSTDLLPYSYPTNDVPTTGSLANTFDNTWIDARNSFHWDQVQYAALSETFRNSGNFNDLTLADYKLADISHWLYWNNSQGHPYVRDTLSLRRFPSPDGTIEGQKQWYDYQGKVYTYRIGTYPVPRFVAQVLPDGSSYYDYFERNWSWAHVTRTISTYTTGESGVGTRTNTFAYASNDIDLLTHTGPTGALMSSNAYNGFHQVTTQFNAAGDMTTFTYDATSHKLTSVKLPTGLITTNLYYTSGTHVGWLYQTLDYEGSTYYRTNTFTYSSGLVATHTGERGAVTTNSWDNLMRPTTVSDARGTLSYSYNKLNAAQTVDRLLNTNLFKYNELGQLTEKIDPRGYTNSLTYTNAELIAITNALGEITRFTHDCTHQLIQRDDPNGVCTFFKYSSLGQLTNITDAVGVSITNKFNNQGLFNVSTGAFGQITKSLYDVFDRATNVTHVTGVVVEFTYDLLGRVLTKKYPDTGLEQFQYGPRGLMAYTNQLGKVTRYGYDPLGRKIAETNAHSEVVLFAYNGAGDLRTLTDAKNQVTQWQYDPFGRVTNKLDAAGASILRFKYDAQSRLTNRWTAAKGDTFYGYDQMGNLTNVNYAVSPDISFSYDALNRTTNMIDGIGTSRYTYAGCCSSTGAEDGPWDSDTLTYSYTSNNFRATLSVALPGSAPWQHTYTYDAASRLKTIISPAGTFSYDYSGASQLIKQLNLPNGSWITNTYDNMARLTNTWLRPNTWSGLNQHVYAYNVGNQRTKHTRTGGDYVDYTYDNIGQLKTAFGSESGGSARLNEKYGYSYDAAGNLYQRTNNALTQTFNVNNLNQLTTAGRSGTLTVAGTSSSSATSVTVNGSAATRYADYTFAKDGVSLSDGTNTFTATAQDSLGRSDSTTNTVYLPATGTFSYDSNGNLLSDGRRGFEYDDENQLIRVTVTNAWKSEFSYDGNQRRRLRKEFTWQNSAWAQTAEVRYVYDGMLVIQERDGNNLPLVTYTRGLDLGGGLEAAGGIRGLLARIDNGALVTQPSSAHAYYHADGNGNVTMLVSQQKAVVAHYVYDPYGNRISARGPLAEVNLYRFSSKETDTSSGLVYFGYRYYEATLQRWLNRDPIEERDPINVYTFVRNSPTAFADAHGLEPIMPSEDNPVVTTGNVTIRWVPELATYAPGQFIPTAGYLAAHKGSTYYYPHFGSYPLELKTLGLFTIDFLPSHEIHTFAVGDDAAEHEKVHVQDALATAGQIDKFLRSRVKARIFRDDKIGRAYARCWLEYVQNQAGRYLLEFYWIKTPEFHLKIAKDWAARFPTLGGYTENVIQIEKAIAESRKRLRAYGFLIKKLYRDCEKEVDEMEQ